MHGVAGDDVLAGTRRHGGRPFHHRTEGTHDQRPVRLLLHGNLHLVDSRLQPEHLRSIGQGGPPLAGTGLRGDVRNAFLLAVVALRKGRVDLVRAQRIHAFVLEVDVGRRVKGFLQGVGTDERCRTVIPVHIQHLFRNVNPCVLRVKLLTRTFHAEDLGKILGFHGLVGDRMEGRKRFDRHIRLNVVPLCGNVLLVEQVSFLVCHTVLFYRMDKSPL